jgi:hypothetical protein
MLLAGRATAAVGALVALVGTFLPWLASGAVGRSSYDLLDIVERLGYSPDGLVGLAFTVWPLAPLLLVLTAIAQWPGWTNAWSAIAAGALALVSAGYVGATALAVLNAPEVGLFRIRSGARVTAIGAVVMLVGAALAGVGLRWGRPTGLDRRARL